MYKGKIVGCIIAAAGEGRRMGGSIPKQFLEIQGETMLAKSVRAFAMCKGIDRVYVVTNEKHMELARHCLTEELSGAEFKKVGAIVSGGDSRQGSVYRGLQAVNAQEIRPDVILIHDGARPFVSEEIIGRIIKKAVECKAALPVVKPKDTIRKESVTLNRDELFSVQTPQGFDFDILFEAYEEAARTGYLGTDDASLVERIGQKVFTVPGSYSNIKVTTEEDIREERRVGTGYDVHRFAAEGSPDRDNIVVLGGCIIPSERDLIAHSDGDVLIHAVMDALLGAAGLGDIGLHFPDDDPEYESASGMMLLRQVKEMLNDAHFSIENIDATVICEEPKVMPYRQEMRANIAQALRIDPGRVNIKGTTTEGLGFEGRGEGIAVQAACIIKR